MASNGSCFMVTWIIFKNHLLEVGLTQIRESMGTPNTYNRWLVLFYHAWGPAQTKIHWNSISLRTRSHMTSHYTWGFVITLHDFGGVLGRPLDTSFWALTVSWSQLLACVWSGPYMMLNSLSKFWEYHLGAFKSLPWHSFSYSHFLVNFKNTYASNYQNWVF